MFCMFLWGSQWEFRVITHFDRCVLHFGCLANTIYVIISSIQIFIHSFILDKLCSNIILSSFFFNVWILHNPRSQRFSLVGALDILTSDNPLWHSPTTELQKEREHEDKLRIILMRGCRGRIHVWARLWQGWRINYVLKKRRSTYTSPLILKTTEIGNTFDDNLRKIRPQSPDCGDWAVMEKLDRDLGQSGSSRGFHKFSDCQAQSNAR